MNRGLKDTLHQKHFRASRYHSKSHKHHRDSHDDVTHGYLKAGSSLLHLGGGDEKALFLLKSFWKRVGGIVSKLSRYRRSLFVVSNPGADPASRLCLHGCHSHMTGISHGSCLVTSFAFLIGRPGRCYYKKPDWLVFLAAVPRGPRILRVDVLSGIVTA